MGRGLVGLVRFHSRSHARLTVLINTCPIIVLVLAALVLSAAAWMRSFEYDEGYSVLVVAGMPRPDWPDEPFPAAKVHDIAQGRAGPVATAQTLRRTDVHPPLYFWALEAWRQFAGTSIFSLRMFSVLCGLAALALVGAIGRLAAIPAASAMLFTLGCYGFAYTSAVARGFALAQALTLGGVTLGLLAARDGRAQSALGAGFLLGAATFTNYLSVFVGGATLAWLIAARPRLPRMWLSAIVGFAVFVPVDLWFFVAQRDSRIGQFPPFHLLASLERLGRYGAGDIVGALPLYAPEPVRFPIAATLAALLVGLACIVLWRWLRIGDANACTLLALGAVAPPLGLLLLGAAFNTTPIELRYLAFSAPFIALLLAGALSRSGRIGGVFGAALASTQALAMAGMLTRAETMQPARATAHTAASAAGPNGIVVLPRGNDGVGAVVPFLAEAPPWLAVQLAAPGETRERLRAACPVPPCRTRAARSRSGQPERLAAHACGIRRQVLACGGGRRQCAHLRACLPGPAGGTRTLSLRLAKRGDSVDPADEQHPLLVNRGIAQGIRPRLASVFHPNPVDLRRNFLAARFPLAPFLLDRAFDLYPVIRILRIDEQHRQPRIFANPLAFRPVRGGVDQNLAVLVIEPHRRQAWPAIGPVRPKVTVIGRSSRLR